MDYEIMGTQNKAVTAYLPEDIEARLAEFCLENGLSRQGKKSGKEKPALGTGIIEVLRIFFAANLDGSVTPPVLNKDELQPSTLPTQSWIQSEIQQAIASLKSELIIKAPEAKKASPKVSEPVKEAKTEAKKPEIQKEEKKIDPLILNQADLARRLKSNPSTLSRHHQKGNKHFTQWSKANDPEKRAWQYRSTEDKNKMFEMIP